MSYLVVGILDFGAIVLLVAEVQREYEDYKWYGYKNGTYHFN